MQDGARDGETLLEPARKPVDPIVAAAVQSYPLEQLADPLVQPGYAVQPAILLLDEPDTGLDLPAYHLLESLLGADGRTILMATHNLEQAKRLCQRAIVLVGGRLVGELPMAELDRDRLAGLYTAPTLAAG